MVGVGVKHFPIPSVPLGSGGGRFEVSSRAVVMRHSSVMRPRQGTRPSLPAPQTRGIITITSIITITTIITILLVAKSHLMSVMPVLVQVLLPPSIRGNFSHSGNLDTTVVKMMMRRRRRNRRRTGYLKCPLLLMWWPRSFFFTRFCHSV